MYSLQHEPQHDARHCDCCGAEKWQDFDGGPDMIDLDVHEEKMTEARETAYLCAVEDLTAKHRWQLWRVFAWGVVFGMALKLTIGGWW